MDRLIPTAGAADLVERLMAQCLELWPDEGERAVHSICSRYPEHAQEIRSGIARLQAVGLLEPAVASEQPLPEQLGDFRLIERIGHGGMGVVYLAEERSLQRRVALKLVRPEHLYFPGARERFRAEVMNVARLHHPSIVSVFSVGEAQGLPFFAMELIDGCTLAEALQQLVSRFPEKLRGEDLASAIAARSRCQSPGDADVAPIFRGRWEQVGMRIALAIAKALQHAHEQGIVHRDVKPSNIMLTVSGRVVLLDFGLAISSGIDRLTRTHSPLGSLPYMAPEQLRGKDSVVNARTDVYGLGVTLYEFLTLRVPYLADDLDQLPVRILEGNTVPVRALNRVVPSDIETVCLVAMDRDPDRRYPTAGGLAHDAERVLSFLPPVARRPGLRLRAYRAMQRHPLRSLLGIGIPIVALLALVLLIDRAHQAALASERLVDVLRLSDSKLLGSLVTLADQLWPARPELLGDMMAWIHEADALAERLPEHRKSLDALRSRALPYDEAAQRQDRASHPQAALLDVMQREQTLAAERGWDHAALDERIRKLSEDVSRRRRWSFADQALQWQHDQLADLVAALERFTDADARIGTIASVRERAADAERLQRECVETARDLWRDTIQTIADRTRSPEYAGLELTPQIGLVPLGRDRGSHLFEFADLRTGVAPERDASGKLRLSDETGLVFVLLPEESLLMGAQADDPGLPNYVAAALPNEKPVHEVFLDPFFISKYEMTQGQWQRATGRTPSQRISGPRMPVNYVSWQECRAVLHRLGLELPTEAQWELAARGGTSSTWWTGEDKTALNRAANIADLSFRNPAIGRQNAESWSDGWELPAPVGSFAPNPFGLYDVLGNVWELCLDRLTSYQAPVTEGTGEHITSSGFNPICRGGSYQDTANVARCTARSTAGEAQVGGDLGLRPARSVER